MIIKRNLATFLGILLVLFLSSPSFAQLQTLQEFKDVKIPWTLKYEDIVIEKGNCDLIFLRHGTNTKLFYLKIKKKGKAICLIPKGERVAYKDQGNMLTLMNDPEIPKNSKLQIKRNPALKIVYIIFESGKHSLICPLHKIRFKVECED
jgi:hypothetical protein